jgi:hypothetical protein
VEDAELRTAKAEQRLALALHEKCDLKLRVTQLHAEVGARPALPHPRPVLGAFFGARGWAAPAHTRSTRRGAAGGALPLYALPPYALPPYALPPYALPPYALPPYAVCCGALLRVSAALHRCVASRRVASRCMQRRCGTQVEALQSRLSTANSHGKPTDGEETNTPFA